MARPKSPGPLRFLRVTDVLDAGRPPRRLGFPKDATGFEYGQANIPRPRESAAFPEGKLYRKAPARQTEWWPPPPSWKLKDPHSSQEEYLVFKALSLILGPEGKSWEFQVSVFGGRHHPAGAVLDFLVKDRSPQIAIRYQSPRFHTDTGVRVRERDTQQRQLLENAGIRVIDIYSQYVMPTRYDGSGAMYWVREALAGHQAPPPVVTRQSRSRM